MKIIKFILIHILIGMLLVGGASYASTITTIEATDTISASRAVINTNFTNLNTDKYQSGDDASFGTLTVTATSTLASTTIVGTVGITGALTATSYGGITEANLLDKSATESISGLYTFTTGITVPNDSISAAELNEGDTFTWTGTHTFSGAGDIVLPAGSVDAGTYAAASIDGDDINSNIAGRSLTLNAASPDTLDVDAELYTDTKCIYIEDPTAADDFKSLWRTTKAITITEVWCESDQTIDFDLQEDDGTPADIIGTDLQCAAGENSTSTAFADAAIAANSEIDLVVTSVANTPTWCSICWTYTKDD